MSNIYTDITRAGGRSNGKDSPDFLSYDYTRMAPHWTLVQDLDEGTSRLREKGTAYLPQMPLEEDPDYRARKDRSVLYNLFGETHKQLVGAVFKKTPHPIGEMPEELDQLLDDVDCCGTDLVEFLREVYSNAMRDGHAFIYVEIPPIPQKEDGSPLTLADDERRPYAISYTANQALNWRFETEGGRTYLSQITFRVVTREADGAFGEAEVTRHYVYRIGSFAVYKSVGNQAPQLEAEGFTGLNEIPLAVVYGKKTGLMTSRPPLLEIAHLNKLHYQKTSDFDNWTHIACVPLLVRKLNHPEDSAESPTVPIGPTVMIDIHGEFADLKYVEVGGKGLELARERTKDLERQIAKLGLEMFSPDHQLTKTATEVISDRGQDESALAMSARSLDEAFRKMLGFMADYIERIRQVSFDREALADVSLNIDYSALTLNVQQLTFFQSMVDKGYLSLRTFLEWLPKVASMPEGFSAEEEIERLADEGTLLKAMIPEPEVIPAEEEEEDFDPEEGDPEEGV